MFVLQVRATGILACGRRRGPLRAHLENIFKSSVLKTAQCRTKRAKESLGDDEGSERSRTRSSLFFYRNKVSRSFASQGEDKPASPLQPSLIQCEIVLLQTHGITCPCVSCLHHWWRHSAGFRAGGAPGVDRRKCVGLCVLMCSDMAS